jgi:hypothetical protein
MRELDEMEIGVVAGGMSIIPLPPQREFRLDELAPEIDPMERPFRE